MFHHAGVCPSILVMGGHTTPSTRSLSCPRRQVLLLLTFLSVSLFASSSLLHVSAAGQVEPQPPLAVIEDSEGHIVPNELQETDVVASEEEEMGVDQLPQDAEIDDVTYDMLHLQEGEPTGVSRRARPALAAARSMARAAVGRMQRNPRIAGAVALATALMIAVAVPMLRREKVTPKSSMARVLAKKKMILAVTAAVLALLLAAGYRYLA